MSILRMPSVKSETGFRSHASIYNAVREGLFTKPVQIGQRAVGWPSDEVLAINRARIAGQSKDQIRTLVYQLHAKRANLAKKMEENCLSNNRLSSWQDSSFEPVLGMGSDI